MHRALHFFRTTAYPAGSPFCVIPCVLPLPAVMVRLKSHAYVFDCDRRTYPPPGFFIVSPSKPPFPFSLFDRLDCHAALYHVIRSCWLCGSDRSLTRSLLLPPMYLLGIRHDLEVAVISILGFHGCSPFQIFVLSLALGRAATSITFDL